MHAVIVSAAPHTSALYPQSAQTRGSGTGTAWLAADSLHGSLTLVITVTAGAVYL